LEVVELIKVILSDDLSTIALPGTLYNTLNLKETLRENIK
jgi:hypothetical protein